MRRATRVSIAAFALLFIAGEAAAQLGGGFPGGGGYPGGGRRGGARSGGGTAEKRPQQETPRVELFQTTLEELRIDLHLDAKQQAAWNTYADRLAELLADVARERRRAQPGAEAALTAPQQIDQIVISAQNRATALEDVAAAAKALYATLTPEQKAVADGRLAHVTSMAISPQTSPVSRHSLD